MSWERLTALAAAHEKKNAMQMLQFMVAAKGDDKSWTAQKERLVKRLKS